MTPHVRSPVFSGTPSQSTEGAPTCSTSPRRTSSSNCRRCQQRLAGAQDERRHAAAGRFAFRSGIERVDEVGERDDVVLRVVLGDVEVRRLHQRATTRWIAA